MATSHWNKEQTAAKQRVISDTVCVLCASSGPGRDVEGEHDAEEPERRVQLHYRDWNPVPHRVPAEEQHTTGAQDRQSGTSCHTHTHTQTTVYADSNTPIMHKKLSAYVCGCMCVRLCTQAIFATSA